MPLPLPVPPADAAAFTPVLDHLAGYERPDAFNDTAPFDTAAFLALLDLRCLDVAIPMSSGSRLQENL